MLSGLKIPHSLSSFYFHLPYLFQNVVFSLYISLFFKYQLTNKSRPDPSDLEHGYMNYWNSASEEEAISKAGRKGNEETKDGREEPSNSETCPAMKGFLTEGLWVYIPA